MVNKQALEDSTAVLEIQQGACNSCSPYQGAICYCSKHTEVPFHSVQVIVACVFLVCVQCTYIMHEQKKIFLYDQRIREVRYSLFAPPALSTGVWEELPHLL